LCHAAGGELEQIQLLLGHVSVQTTERYLGCKQRIRGAVNDRIGLNRSPAAFGARWGHYIQPVQPARWCQSNPTPDPSPIVRICRPKAPLKIKLFRHNYMTMNDEQHWEKEHQGPDRLVQNRYPGIQQSQGKVHRVARKAVGTADGQSRGWAIWPYGSLFV
jgi:hypothetical protein